MGVKFETTKITLNTVGAIDVELKDIVDEPNSDDGQGMNGPYVQHLVDRHLDLAARVAKHMEDPAFKQLEESTKNLRKMLSDREAEGLYARDTGVTLHGTEGYLEVSPRSKSRSVKDMSALVLTMGEELFLQCASVKLGDIDKYLTEEQKALVLSEDYVGTRSITPVYTTTGEALTPSESADSPKKGTKKAPKTKKAAVDG